MATRILLVDDHALFREALVYVLKRLDRDMSVLHASTVHEAMVAISSSQDLNLILLDLKLPGVDGLTALPLIRQNISKVPVVVLSGNEDPQVIRDALFFGAAGFIPKTTSSNEMMHALRLVLGGGVYLPPALTGLVEFDKAMTRTTSLRGDTDLTQRQLEVLELLSLGLPNKSIANHLDLTEGTVKLHVTAILRKLSVRNRTEAAREATQRGLLALSLSTL